MAIKIEVLDRVPTYPGRVVLTPVSGQDNTYDLVRADSPITEGTPLNKALLDQKAYTLTGDVTVYVNGSTGNDLTGDGTSALPFATIQKAIDALPKWLDGYTATIDIADGTYEESVVLQGFHGGILELGSAARNVTLRGVLVNASSYIRINTSITTTGASPLVVRHGSQVQIGRDITLDAASGNAIGIAVQSGSKLGVLTNLFEMTSVTIKNCKFAAVHASGGAMVHLGAVHGSNNATGFRADEGGVITYGMSTLTANTASIVTSGGRVFSDA